MEGRGRGAGVEGWRGSPSSRWDLRQKPVMEEALERGKGRNMSDRNVLQSLTHTHTFLRVR